MTPYLIQAIRTALDHLVRARTEGDWRQMLQAEMVLKEALRHVGA